MVPLGLAALPRQAAHLRLHFADQVIEALEIGGGALEPSLGARLAVAVEADAGRLFEQGTPLLGAVGQEAVDHLRFDDDPGVAAQAGSAQQVLHVTQPHGRLVQQVVTLAAARDPARDHDLVVRDREHPVGVVEDE